MMCVWILLLICLDGQTDAALQAESTLNTTEVEPFLIVATRYNLMKMNLNGSSFIVFKQTQEMDQLDQDGDYQKQIGDLEEVVERLSRMHISDGDVQVLHTMLNSKPTTLAVDWVGRNLYWCNSDRATIEVSKLNGSYPAVLVNNGLDRPYAIVVDVRYGYLYWSDIRYYNPHIGRIGMDGTNRRIIVKDKTQPYGLTIDYINDQIYWTNQNENCIEFANLDGTNRHAALRAEATRNTTEVEPFLIVATRNNLMKINLDGSSSTKLKQGLFEAMVLDFDYQQQMIYWTELIDWNNTKISGMHISGSDVQVLHDLSLNSPVAGPTGLAVDWVGGNLYWGDAGRATIEVSKLNGSYPTVLVDIGLERPASIAVDVRYGYLYWSDVSDNNPHIERIGMDGTNRTVIVKDKISHPYGLTLDYINDHIYWTSEKTYIEFANLDGTNRHTVVRQGNIRLITLFEDFIYWTTHESIYRANRTEGTNYIRLISNLKDTSGIHIYHPYRQPWVSGHPCQTNNGGCSHLCLLSPGGGYKCASPPTST